MRRIPRRTFLRYSTTLSLVASTGAAGALAAACGGGGKGGGAPISSGQYGTLDPRTAANFTIPLRLPDSAGGLLGMMELSAPIEITARRQQVELLTGKRTDLLTYEVKAGDRTYLNPIVRVQRGAAVSARLVNGLDEPTTIHWHGLHLDWRNDGHPSSAVPAGGAYAYRFVVQNRAGTYWYHPHTHNATARQAYGGLAGLFIVEDEDEQRLRDAMDLQLGSTDIPLVFQDRLFDDRGNVVYPSTPMDGFQGVVGDVVLLNGTPKPVVDVETRAYRFRVLNGSNARLLRLVAVQGDVRLPLQLLGTDGGLLDQSRQVTELFVAPAERVDVLVDLRTLSAGDTVFLKSHAFDPMHLEMPGTGTPAAGRSSGGHGGMSGMGGSIGGGAMGSTRLPDGAEFNLLKLAVTNRVAYDRALPSTLSRIMPIDTGSAPRRPITLSADGMRWLINGTRFDLERELFQARANSVEVWEIRNARASMPHPMHLHGFQFQVLERRGSPPQLRDGGVDGQGRTATDRGWKDTVLVWPGETVTIAIDFSHQFSGDQLYTFHCHNLEHEDGGMMVNYRVT